MTNLSRSVNRAVVNSGRLFRNRLIALSTSLWTTAASEVSRPSGSSLRARSAAKASLYAASSRSERKRSADPLLPLSF